MGNGVADDFTLLNDFYWNKRNWSLPSNNKFNTLFLVI